MLVQLLAAIAGLRDEVRGKLILIAGGDGKGADFTELASVLRQQVDVLITLGKDGPAIAALVPGAIEVATLAAAVVMAAQQAQSGDLVLLSPACASLDMFKNYEQRGDLFAAGLYSRCWYESNCYKTGFSKSAMTCSIGGRRKMVSVMTDSFFSLMVLLLCIGFVMVTSASVPVAERLFGNPLHYSVRHLVYVLVWASVWLLPC